MTESYVCPNCGRVEDRPYRVRYFIFTCSDCGENGRFLNESLVDRLDEIPEPSRPDDWKEMPLDERLLYAVREDLLDVRLTGPF